MTLGRRRAPRNWGAFPCAVLGRAACAAQLNRGVPPAQAPGAGGSREGCVMSPVGKWIVMAVADPVAREQRRRARSRAYRASR